MDRTSRDRIASRGLALACALALSGALPGCSSQPKPKEGCLRIAASSNLNYHDDQPHVVTLFVFPLSSTVGFEQTPVDELLAGATPPGVEGPAVHVSVKPGEEDKRFEDLFPAQTLFLGVVANYYRSPGDPEGSRTQIVPARCGWRSPKLSLAAKDIYLE